MRDFLNIVNETEEIPSFGFVKVKGFIGQTLEFYDIPLRNVRLGDGGYGYKVEMLHGKKWQEGSVSPLRLMKPGFNLVPNSYLKVEGGIWFNEKERYQAMLLLKNEIEKFLTDLQDKIKKTLNSL